MLGELVTNLNRKKVPLGLVLVGLLVSYQAGRFGYDWLHEAFLPRAEAEESQQQLVEQMTRQNTILNSLLRKEHINEAREQIRFRESEIYRIQQRIEERGDPGGLAAARVDQLQDQVNDLEEKIECIKDKDNEPGDCEI